jgi:NitT/TauT family transport system substrate-binding protein
MKINKLYHSLGFSLLALGLFSGCNNFPSFSGGDGSAVMGRSPEATDTLYLALDWRPNVLHAGIFWAQSQGWYNAEDLVVKWTTPEVDGYIKKPIQRLLDAEVDLAIGPSEHLFSYAVKGGQVKAQAIATLLQDDRSAFVLKAKRGVKRPKQIDSTHVYLGYHTPLEREILSSMIVNDTGFAAYQVQEPGRLEVWESFMRDSGDIAWVFLHWEALMAQRDSVKLVSFRPSDYGVPYGYSSVLMAPSVIDSLKERQIRKFLRITEKGYRAVVAAGSDLRGKVLQNNIEHYNFSNQSFVELALQDIQAHFFNGEGTWGKMEAKKWENYALWLESKGLMSLDSTAGIGVHDFYSNRYLSP